MESVIPLVTMVLPILVVIGAILAGGFGLARLYRKVGPEEGMVVYGGGEPKVVTAAGTFVIPFRNMTQRITLKVLTIKEDNDEVITTTGVKVVFNWNAQVQVIDTSAGILTATRAFAGKTEDEIRAVAKETLAANFRDIVSKMDPVQILREKDTFAQNVLEIVAPDLASMGLKVLTLNIRELNDNQGFYEAMGAPQIAEMKRDAAIATANADRDAEIARAEAKRDSRQRQATANKAAADTEAQTSAEIALAVKEQQVKEAAYKQESETARAQADLAYQLREAEIQDQLITNQGQMEVQRQLQMAKAAEKAIAVAEMEQRAEVVVPAEMAKQAAVLNADAGAYKAQKDAEGQAAATKLRADGEAHKRVAEAEAEAKAVKAAATAEATRVRETQLATAEGITATGEAQANADRARLLAQAEGEEQLAAARASQDEINLRLEIAKMLIDAQRAVGIEAAGAAGKIGENVRLVQFAGGNGSGAGSTGNGLVDLLMRVPELTAMFNAKTGALHETDIAGILSQVAQLIRGTGEVVSEASATEQA